LLGQSNESAAFGGIVGSARRALAQLGGREDRLERRRCYLAACHNASRRLRAAGVLYSYCERHKTPHIVRRMLSRWFPASRNKQFRAGHLHGIVL
jgi:hypothetical protein